MTAAPGRELSEVLQGIVDLLNASGHPYCMLHGYSDFPDRVESDVDCLVAAELVPGELARLIARDRKHLGAVLVQWLQHEATAHYFVLASDRADSTRPFLALDVCADYRARGRVFYRGHELLAQRRRHRDFWIPPPALEFGYCLVKRIGKGALDQVHANRLSELYRQDPVGCRGEIARFWNASDTQLLAAAAAGGEWAGVMRALPPLRRRLLAPTSASGLRDRAEYWCLDTLRRARRWQRPTGLLVVLLGADGAGKSTVSEAVRQRLAPLFRQVIGGHFAPDLLGRAAARGASGSGSPHDQTARSRLGSVAKSLYWLFDFSVGYWARIRPALVRSTLVVYDRYLPDALVDPRRYRFRGPSWLLRAVCRLVPAPDLLVLLDASVATLRARKQEVTAGETQRQQGEYRALVAGWPSGHVVNADGPVDQVVATVDRVVLEHLARRTAERLGI